ncbi:MAG: hypothetical protein SGJ15_04055 [Bacteroidota bacterium]|nr:hypothetical protein [Bacteroidota bacterium]
MRAFKLIFPVMVAAAVTLTSCHKKETVEVDNETQSVVDNAVAEQEFMSMVPAVNSVAIKTKGTGADANKTAVVPCDSLRLVSGDTLWASPTHVHPTFSLTLTNATCSPIPDAKLREGVLFITFFGKVKTTGSRMKVVLVGYKAANADPAKKISYQCDSIVVKTVSNNPTTDIRIFNVKIYNGKCVGPTNNWTTLYSTDRTITHNMATDNISIYGTSNGTNRLNRKFTVDVPAGTPLVKKSSCQFITSGILNLTPEGFKTRTVDYSSGNAVGACDDDATFSVNGNTVAFKLK